MFDSLANNSNLRSGRLFWGGVLALPLFCVAIAHLFFQNYLYMPPCEHCVYVRFFMLVIALGAVFALLWRVLTPLGYALGFYGCFEGARVCLHLEAIHKAVASGNPFGVKPCKMMPEYPFGLKLDEWWPAMFKPTGECGFDAPVPPFGAKLDAVQTWFCDFYANGWYLLPQFEFLDMAMASLGIFIFIGILLLVRLALDISNLKKGRL